MGWLGEIGGIVANAVIPGWQEYRLWKNGAKEAVKYAAIIDGFTYLFMAAACLAAKDSPETLWMGGAFTGVARLAFGKVVEDRLNFSEKV